MKDHFRMFAAYNSWANGLLYDAASTLTPQELQADKGAFFGSLLNTLNHILVADRVWLHRLTGEGMLPTALDQVLYGDFEGLRDARIAEDARLAAYVEALTEDELGESFIYSPIGKTDRITQKRSVTLAHVFNHQTHHRGQAHSTLTALGKPSLALDLVYFLRSEGRQWL